MPRFFSSGTAFRASSFAYYFTGKRVGPSGQIELHLTSVVTDWQENVYVRRAWFMGHKEGWKEVIRLFILYHLDGLSTGIQLRSGMGLRIRGFMSEGWCYLTLGYENNI